MKASELRRVAKKARGNATFEHAADAFALLRALASMSLPAFASDLEAIWQIHELRERGLLTADTYVSSGEGEDWGLVIDLTPEGREAAADEPALWKLAADRGI
ncbi:hypothetical protein [Acidovorax facilis]|uniref:hypothetical protein n=1 Tax=Acidovorax facilis TaxID=12917 RepID=UPI003D64C303